MSPKLFNILVDAVLWQLLLQVLCSEVAESGFTASNEEQRNVLRQVLMLFYADDGFLVS